MWGCKKEKTTGHRPPAQGGGKPQFREDLRPEQSARVIPNGHTTLVAFATANTQMKFINVGERTTEQKGPGSRRVLDLRGNLEKGTERFTPCESKKIKKICTLKTAETKKLLWGKKKSPKKVFHIDNQRSSVPRGNK